MIARRSPSKLLSRPVNGLVDPSSLGRRLAVAALSACVLVLAASCPNVNEHPVAVMDCDHLAGTSPLEVTFDATGSHDPDGFIIRYEWDFGDSTAGQGQTASHTYTATTDTTYAARLTVTDDEGLADSDERQIIVWAPTPSPAPPPTPPAPCNCAGPDLDCSDFSSHAKAQACYDFCKGQGHGDVFNLDADNDGNACESLP
ncbi:MAG: PKD domain-containing protein [Candidatus Bipolaricaulis sp.]|nr:PKD domain-containing protein [Candidatus Bipolaricaulis sp.]